MRNLLVLATLSSFLISCATVKSWMGSEEAPATQEQAKPADQLDLGDSESANAVTPPEETAAAPAAAEDGAELSNHADPYVAEAAGDLAAQSQAPAENYSGDSTNLPQTAVNEEMDRSAPSWQGEPTPAIANVAPEEPQVYNSSSSYDSPKKSKKNIAKSLPAKKGKEKAAAKKPKIDCKKVAKQGKKAKKPEVAYCKAEKKALAKAKAKDKGKATAGKKAKVDCKKVAKMGKKAKKPDIAFCKDEKKKKSKSRVASK
ncbi:hypothetical protein ACLVWU_04265 [Bdellovibrio sp. HCB290]|uniref:hypothetical protein n=1 Tax=Bdellovibrio sp. HCB290 TaxID=3394356 RepID=UPI0039B6779F